MISNANLRTFTLMVLCTVVATCWHGVASSQDASPSVAAESAPDLPEGVTLQQLAERKKHTCTYVGDKAVKHEDGPKYIAPIEVVMPPLMKLKPDSLERMAAAPGATPTMKSLCAFLKRSSCPNDVAEAVIRANCKEKLYCNKDLIDAAAPHCNPHRVASWRQKYQNQ